MYVIWEVLCCWYLSVWNNTSGEGFKDKEPVGRERSWFYSTSMILQHSRVGPRRQKKTCINEKIMSKMTKRLDNKMKMENRHILWFLDNTTSTVECSGNSLTYSKRSFLPKNKISRLEPLAAGVIGAEIFQTTYKTCHIMPWWR